MNNTIKLIIASLLTLIPVIGIVSIVFIMLEIIRRNFSLSALTWVILGIIVQIYFIYSGLNMFKIFNLEEIQYNFIYINKAN
ncbi:hypothetical protein [Macrococcoides canis]|uniref:Uncharacterized protein n=1 Tax=Macrococcoides canis TaxID=1855823 RepID=A0AAE7C0W4_9STAP|nr:hypothetical protein [Macrococcus canis]QIH79075.1 hypothetical protein GTN30_10505 [Macrococcus canis]QNR08599.1 hypothetical protein GL258_10250 [Macrococcus canis]